MVKQQYIILSNFNELPEESKQNLMEKWNHLKAELMIKEILNLPLHIQEPVFKKLIEGFFYIDCSQ